MRTTPKSRRPLRGLPAVHSGGGKRWAGPLALLAVSMTACGDETPTEPDPGPEPVSAQIQGEVSAEEPVEGAEVAVYPAGSDEAYDQTTSGGDGVYELAFEIEEAEAPDDLRLEAEADGYEAYETTVPFQESLDHDVELDAAGTDAVASGTVTSRDEGEPIEDATVTGRLPETEDELFEATTDGDGVYEAAFTVAEEPEHVTIEAVGEGYERAATEIPFSAEMDADLALDEQRFAGGSGTEGDPYLIETLEQLQRVDEELHAHYLQVADIDATPTQDWNDGQGFEPIGDWDSEDGFFGSLDGGGHVIEGLTIDRPEENNVGLFNFVQHGRIENVTLTDASVTGDTRVGGLIGWSVEGEVHGSSMEGEVAGDFLTIGGLVGRLEEGEIRDSHAESTIHAAGASTAGGLVGSASGDIHGSSAVSAVEGFSVAGGLAGDIFGEGEVRDSYAEGTVGLGADGGGSVGGLVGSNRSSFIHDSWSEADVTSNGERIGGLVGRNSGEIHASRASGDVEGGNNHEVGGLVGINRTEGEIRASFAEGDVASDSWNVGGLVGRNTGEARIADSYATGTVTAEVRSGGLVGSNQEEAVIETSYAVGSVPDGGLYAGNNSAEIDAGYYRVRGDQDGVDRGDDEGVTGLEEDEMMGESADEHMDELDFDDVWRTDSDDFPVLRWQDG